MMSFHNLCMGSSKIDTRTPNFRVYQPYFLLGGIGVKLVLIQAYVRQAGFSQGSQTLVQISSADSKSPYSNQSTVWISYPDQSDSRQKKQRLDEISAFQLILHPPSMGCLVRGRSQHLTIPPQTANILASIGFVSSTKHMGFNFTRFCVKRTPFSGSAEFHSHFSPWETKYPILGGAAKTALFANWPCVTGLTD